MQPVSITRRASVRVSRGRGGCAAGVGGAGAGAGLRVVMAGPSATPLSFRSSGFGVATGSAAGSLSPNAIAGAGREGISGVGDGGRRSRSGTAGRPGSCRQSGPAHNPWLSGPMRSDPVHQRHIELCSSSGSNRDGRPRSLEAVGPAVGCHPPHLIMASRSFAELAAAIKIQCLNESDVAAGAPSVLLLMGRKEEWTLASLSTRGRPNPRHSTRVAHDGGGSAPRRLAVLDFGLRRSEGPSFRRLGPPKLRRRCGLQAHPGVRAHGRREQLLAGLDPRAVPRAAGRPAGRLRRAAREPVRRPLDGVRDDAAARVVRRRACDVRQAVAGQAVSAGARDPGAEGAGLSQAGAGRGLHAGPREADADTRRGLEIHRAAAAPRRHRAAQHDGAGNRKHHLRHRGGDQEPAPARRRRPPRPRNKDQVQGPALREPGRGLLDRARAARRRRRAGQLCRGRLARQVVAAAVQGRRGDHGAGGHGGQAGAQRADPARGAALLQPGQVPLHGVHLVRRPHLDPAVRGRGLQGRRRAQAQGRRAAALGDHRRHQDPDRQRARLRCPDRHPNRPPPRDPDQLRPLRRAEARHHPPHHLVLPRAPGQPRPQGARGAVQGLQRRAARPGHQGPPGDEGARGAGADGGAAGEEAGAAGGRDGARHSWPPPQPPHRHPRLLHRPPQGQGGPARVHGQDRGARRGHLVEASRDPRRNARVVRRLARGDRLLPHRAARVVAAQDGDREPVHIRGAVGDRVQQHLVRGQHGPDVQEPEGDPHERLQPQPHPGPPQEARRPRRRCQQVARLAPRPGLGGPDQRHRRRAHQPRGPGLQRVPHRQAGRGAQAQPGHGGVQDEGGGGREGGEERCGAVCCEHGRGRRGGSRGRRRGHPPRIDSAAAHASDHAPLQGLRDAVPRSRSGSVLWLQVMSFRAYVAVSFGIQD